MFHVKQSALDAARLGFAVTVRESLCRAIDLDGSLAAAREGMRGKGRIGTTGRGIGPAYQDRAQRRAVRGHVLTDPVATLRQRALALMEEHNHELFTLFVA